MIRVAVMPPVPARPSRHVRLRYQSNLTVMLQCPASVPQARPLPLATPRIVAQPAPAPRIGQLERVRKALAAEIAPGSISVDPFGGWIAIRVGNLITFASGQANVLPDFVPVGRRIAELVETEAGPVRIIGHTDDQALSGGPYRDNQALSVARAEAVAELLRGALTDPNRIEVDGRGTAASRSC